MTVGCFLFVCFMNYHYCILKTTLVMSTELKAEISAWPAVPSTPWTSVIKALQCIPCFWVNMTQTLAILKPVAFRKHGLWSPALLLLLSIGFYSEFFCYFLPFHWILPFENYLQHQNILHWSLYWLITKAPDQGCLEEKSNINSVL